MIDGLTVIDWRTVIISHRAMGRTKNPNPYFRGMKFSASKMFRLHPQDVPELARHTPIRSPRNWISKRGSRQSRIAPLQKRGAHHAKKELFLMAHG